MTKIERLRDKCEATELNVAVYTDELREILDLMESMRAQLEYSSASDYDVCEKFDAWNEE